MTPCTQEDDARARSCVFCGSSNLTREHVQLDSLTEIGLDLERSTHHAGPINRLPNEWSARPNASGRGCARWCARSRTPR